VTDIAANDADPTPTVFGNRAAFDWTIILWGMALVAVSGRRRMPG
jgi:hypothetical protein